MWVKFAACKLAVFVTLYLLISVLVFLLAGFNLRLPFLCIHKVCVYAVMMFDI